MSVSFIKANPLTAQSQRPAWNIQPGVLWKWHDINSLSNQSHTKVVEVAIVNFPDWSDLMARLRFWVTYVANIWCHVDSSCTCLMKGCFFINVYHSVRPCQLLCIFYESVWNWQHWRTPTGSQLTTWRVVSILTQRKPIQFQRAHRCHVATQTIMRCIFGGGQIKIPYPLQWATGNEPANYTDQFLNYPLCIRE